MELVDGFDIKINKNVKTVNFDVKCVRTHYEGKSGVVYDSRTGIVDELGLERTINIIGYENILDILVACPSGGYGEPYYTIIYKLNKNLRG